VDQRWRDSGMRRGPPLAASHAANQLEVHAHTRPFDGRGLVNQTRMRYPGSGRSRLAATGRQRPL